jgi:SAM-dependent methyltransferase
MSSSPSPNFDASRFKRLERDGYNLIAPRYGAAAASRAPLQRALLDAAELAPGLTVLDVASGPGTLAAEALPRVQPGGRVVASDLADAMLVESRRHSPDLLAAAADAESLPFADASFDRVLCGLGLMFFPAPARALAEMRRVLRPGGRLALSVWGGPGQVPLVECAQAAIRRVLPAPKVSRPSVLRFGDAAGLTELLDQAGFAGGAVSACDLVSEFANAADYWRAFLDLAGGAAGSLARLPGPGRERLASAVAEDLAPYAVAGAYRMTSRVLIAAAKGAAL